MSRRASGSAVLTIRVPRDLERRLAQEARRRRQTRSRTARALLDASLAGVSATDPVAEARRQSRLASSRQSEGESLEFIAAAADLKGWR